MDGEECIHQYVHPFVLGDLADISYSYRVWGLHGACSFDFIKIDAIR